MAIIEGGGREDRSKGERGVTPMRPDLITRRTMLQTSGALTAYMFAQALGLREQKVIEENEWRSDIRKEVKDCFTILAKAHRLANDNNLADNLLRAGAAVGGVSVAKTNIAKPSLRRDLVDFVIPYVTEFGVEAAIEHRQSSNLHELLGVATKVADGVVSRMETKKFSKKGRVKLSVEEFRNQFWREMENVCSQDILIKVKEIYDNKQQNHE